MAKEMIVSVNGREKKIAIIEDDVVTEFYVERGDENQGIVGNIYKGRVMKVLPGMQSAFVDIGLERDSFLYVSDFLEDEEFEGVFVEEQKESQGRHAKAARSERPRHGRPAEPAVAETDETEDDKEAELQAAALSHIEELSEEPVIEIEPDQIETEAVVAVTEELAEDEKASARQRRRQRLSYQEKEPATETVVAAETEEPGAAVEEVAEIVASESEEAAEEESSRGRRRRRPRRRKGEETTEPAEVKAVETVSAETTEAQVSPVEIFEPVIAPLPQEQFERVEDDAADVMVQAATIDQLRSEGYITTMLEVEPTPDAHVGSLQTAIGSSSEFERISDDSGETAQADEEEATAEETVVKEVSEDRTLHAAQSLTETIEIEEPSLADAEAQIREPRPREEFATRRGGRGRRYRQRPALSDATTETETTETEPASQKEEGTPATPALPRTNGRTRPVISDLLREGQEVLVQIAKEPIGQKGARITSHIAMPGRYIVYMPTVEHIGVSRKIGTDDERLRLRRTLHQLRAEDNIPGGFIVRTAAAGRTTDELRDDVQYLFRTWSEIRRRADRGKAPAIIHRDLDLVQRILRDQLSSDFSAIRVDNEYEYERIVDFVSRFAPKLVRRVKLYTKDTPILEEYSVQAEIDKAVKPRVWLKSGGYIVINQTEALVAIDVNTGKFVGRSNRLEDTIVKTNMEAAREIARQIRLRDLGGIIVLDFIDMEERRNRIKVMQTLEQELRQDKSPSKVLQFNDFGLVAITRKRVKQSLERTLCTPCQYCGGGGMVKSAQTVCYEILADARRIAKASEDYSEVILRVNPDVAKSLRSTERDVLNEIESYIGTPLTIKSDPTVHQEQFDIALI